MIYCCPAIHFTRFQHSCICLRALKCVCRLDMNQITQYNYRIMPRHYTTTVTRLTPNVINEFMGGQVVVLFSLRPMHIAY